MEKRQKKFIFINSLESKIDKHLIEIAQGKCKYLFPEEIISKNKRVMCHYMHNPCIIRTPKIAAQLMELYEYLPFLRDWVI